MLLNQDIGKWVFSISIISIIGFIITGNVLGIVYLFSNPTLGNTLFGIALFCPATFILFASIFSIIYGGYIMMISDSREIFMQGGVGFTIIRDSDDGRKLQGLRLTKKSIIAIFITGTFILLSDVTLLNVPFGRHLLFTYSFLLLLLFCSQVYRGWLAIPEEDRYARFIALLEDILLIQFHEEWLGDLQEQHYQLIEEGIPRWKVSLITLLTGLGLILSYLWLKADKLVSRWMTRAK